MGTSSAVRDFYNKFYSEKHMEHNERHSFLIQALLQAGMRADSIILEIGCGAGIMTSLMAHTVTRGRIVSSDISAKSIELAKANNKQFKNVEFIVADSTEFEFPRHKYDFIVFFDVLEHIQEQNRGAVIKMIAGQMGDNTKLLLNVPAPEAHRHAIKETPELMQIVDVPVRINDLLPLLDDNGLEIHSFITYDMWQNDEYQLYSIKRKQPYVFRKMTPPADLNPNSLSKRIARRIKKLRIR